MKDKKRPKGKKRIELDEEVVADLEVNDDEAVKGGVAPSTSTSRVGTVG